ncbi:LemA family protein [Planctomycetes bacterium Pla163]|uniref:RING-type E3 ubiquitin transferase n=1 Tax=Rohdeia mirabilis TaxID=2528008 RepID=A0A518D2V0_9BACT|nr:LemA family protein [Planctomycetes bacterium Pla163]
MPDPSHPALWIAPLLGALFAALCLWRSYVLALRERLVANLPTSKTTGVFIGLVELEGRARTDAPLRSFLAEEDCVHYTWDVSEHWSRTVTETYTDSKGRSRTRTRRESGWKSVASGGDTIDFFLEDDEGEVLVRPAGADLETETIFSETCGRWDDLYYAKGPPGAVAHSDHRRRFTEQAIVNGADLYIIGRANERDDVVAPQIAFEKDARMFLISTRGQEAVRTSLGRGYWGWTVFAGFLAAGGVAVGDAIANLAVETRWPNYVLAGALTWFAVAPLVWLLMAYNGLIDLRHRVESAWRQVDIQLERRATLIPNLVRAVQALAGHERDTQEALAQMRTQLGATAPGERGPDHHQLRQRVSILVERYPELTADVNFRQLQDELIATEQRIALARAYYNEIATHHNVRLLTVPERWVAALANLRRRELVHAEAFEREAVEVRLVGAGTPAHGADPSAEHAGEGEGTGDDSSAPSAQQRD